ncbi:NAD(P)H-dependent flavin oxidoreductase [Mycolicibacterium monacense]|uniref:2-nitropropane dioxygenase n=2 Tax=Mycobacteriaceae TaxID=1762 RepID=A0AAD1IY48_MYCMB|nr:nitronate monooxygenase [Mycolicibacterium monacense]MDA4104189.1 2-nitropropane dioxygenase [Mycolicibacterium monacense DSM 44395]ORB15956.1 2-nitropropane dioxygenase [Mycolicibacterium monacense DSM 44395]QHP85040.1 nitronate monooxygenase [Mycolicibacterium monacense DSM 44395]BBZ62130.1 2-nitropropane dioxygenase [Mycolicibacterium monacense]
MPLSTPWCRAMGCEVPIVNAPMGGAAGGRLAAAVSRAGGLGMVGMGSAGTAEQLDAELDALAGLDRPFGIGLVHWVVEARPDLLERALCARPALLSVSFGEDWSWVRRAQEVGAAAVAQVGTAAAARRAVDAGIDVLVARGAEGGGHGEPRVGTLALLTDLLERFDVPVLAAGGIASGRGLAAVLAAGASAAWIGTGFAACPEATTQPAARAALVAAEGDQTTLTRAFDIDSGYPWPDHLPERVLTDGAGRATPVNAGQGVGMVTKAEPAADLIARLCAEAEGLLRRWVSSADAG